MYWIWFQRTLYTVCQRLWFYLRKNGWLTITLPPTLPLPPTPLEKFVRPIQQQFFDTLRVMDISETCVARKEGVLKNNEDWSHNISPLFYDQKTWQQGVEDPNNPLEKEWKQRMLLINTPLDNILMYYHAQKAGFVYFCDHSSVPYPLLNALAMKYTMTYRCRDFFLDEQVYEESGHKYHNGILQSLKKEEEEEKNKNKISQEVLNQPDVFVKKTSSNHTYHHAHDDRTNEKRVNKFLYMGKLNNASFCQPKQKNHGNMNYTEFKHKSRAKRVEPNFEHRFSELGGFPSHADLATVHTPASEPWISEGNPTTNSLPLNIFC